MELGCTGCDRTWPWNDTRALAEARKHERETDTERHVLVERRVKVEKAKT